MRIKESDKDELRDLYIAKRDATEVWSEACSAVAAKYGVKPGQVKQRIRLEVENKLADFEANQQLVLSL